MVVKVITACSPLLVALTVAASAVEGQTPRPTSSQQVTVVGCVARNGAVDPDKGTRILNTEPNGLALMEARIMTAGGGRASAVPGSAPEGRDSGTIPQQTIVGPRPQESAPLSFALSGGQLKELGSYVGRRVEIVGRTATAADRTGSGEIRGTSGATDPARSATRGESTAPGSGTREERPSEAPTAHPSAEMQKLDVISFRAVTGACE